MNIIDTFENFINPEARKLEIKNMAQMELIQMDGGDDIAGTWIDKNAKRFNELLEDPRNNFYELLADEKTHAEALEQIRSKFYH